MRAFPVRLPSGACYWTVLDEDLVAVTRKSSQRSGAPPAGRLDQTDERELFEVIAFHPVVAVACGRWLAPSADTR
jgi:hypothetical protein